MRANFTPVPRLAFFAYFHLLRKVAAPPTDNSVSTCRLECSANSPKSSYCLAVAIDPVNATGLRRLQELAATNPTTITSQELHEMFGIADDPCARQDTTIVGGNLTNLGNDCDLTVHLPTTALVIKVPKILTGRWQRKAGTTEVLFDDPKTRGSLHFTDPDLDLDWGGDIVNMFSESNYVGMGVGKVSCVRATLK